MKERRKSKIGYVQEDWDLFFVNFDRKSNLDVVEHHKIFSRKSVIFPNKKVRITIEEV